MGRGLLWMLDGKKEDLEAAIAGLEREWTPPAAPGATAGST